MSLAPVGVKVRWHYPDGGTAGSESLTPDSGVSEHGILVYILESGAGSEV